MMFSTFPVLIVPDESDTATGDKVSGSKDPRLKEVHLKIPDRQAATDSGSETEVTYNSTCEPIQVTSNYSVALPPRKNKQLSSDRDKRSKKECIVM